HECESVRRLDEILLRQDTGAIDDLLRLGGLCAERVRFQQALVAQRLAAARASGEVERRRRALGDGCTWLVQIDQRRVIEEALAVVGHWRAGALANDEV